MYTPLLLGGQIIVEFDGRVLYENPESPSATPKESSVGYVVRAPALDEILVQGGNVLDIVADNNMTEAFAMKTAIQEAVSHPKVDPSEMLIRIHGDSRNVIDAARPDTSARFSDENIQSVIDESWNELSSFKMVRFKCVDRDENERAHTLAQDL